jgi:ribosomal protein RSM22 (predicted rRNA methylase)
LGAVSNIDPFYHMAEYLPDALRQNAPQWESAIGMTGHDAFSALYADPMRLREFAGLMNALSLPQGHLIADSFNFAPHSCIMDVAGGPGGQAIAIGLKYPHLRGIITDMEPICVVAREQIKAKNLSDRFTAVAADLMEGPYPAGADIIILGHVLHDWSDENCRRILHNCAAVLPPSGVLLISESVLKNDFSGSAAAHMKDLVMLLANEPGARERSESEYELLLDDAGFKVDQLMRLEAPRDLLVARRR